MTDIFLAVEALHTELVRHFDSPQVSTGEPAAQPDFVKLEALGYQVGLIADTWQCARRAHAC